MLLTVKKEIEETVEVKTPCWMVNGYGWYAHITEGGDLIQIYGGSISLMDASDPFTAKDIAKIASTYNSCTEAEFKEQLDKRLYKLEETYTRA